MRITMPPTDPDRLSYYHYALSILDHVLCEKDEIVFSDFLHLKKIRDISDPLGAFILGEEAINRSRSLSDRDWNAKSSEDGIPIYDYPPF